MSGFVDYFASIQCEQDRWRAIVDETMNGSEVWPDALYALQIMRDTAKMGFDSVSVSGFKPAVIEWLRSKGFTIVWINAHQFLYLSQKKK